MRTRTPRQSVEFARARAGEHRRLALGLAMAYRGLPAVREGSMSFERLARYSGISAAEHQHQLIEEICQWRPGALYEK